MHIETIIKICSYSVPWELDKRDEKVIMKHQHLLIRDIVRELWNAAQRK